MRQYTNTKLIARRARIARYATFGGLAILVGSLVLSASAENIPLAYLALIAGFTLAYVGSTQANRFIREPRADQALERALKGFDNKHSLYNFLLPAPHVLLTPTGLIVLLVKANDGRVLCQQDRWTNPFRFGRLFGGMGREPLGNPSQDALAQINRLKQFLAPKIENAALVPIDAYVVFSDPKVALQIEGARFTTVRADALKETLRKAKRGAALSPQLFEQLQKSLDESAHDQTAK